ncbi:GbsR/MarR family transcriptional regulator [Nonomuraea endophytica]|uniref:GbsR/MarR family transcriptional regulator n=1 Tax=Nonomuraea endophytica TaxID=714136 RepID=UPI0037C941CB
MPGDRLTHDERRQIAACVADGLGYAEIARRLGRPTSTISREVARNGGPGGYQADPAQQATGRRAGRRRPYRMVSPTVTHDFAERLAALMSETGLPRMPSRVFVCLLTTESGSLTAAELATRLQVSPASVSKAIAYLHPMGLVGREPDPGGRRERYVVHEDSWLRAWTADTRAHDKVAEATRDGIEILGADTAAGIRLARMGRFFAWISEEMASTVLTEPAVHNALTVLAALVHAARPLTVDELAAALTLPRERVADGLNALIQRPAIADPLTVRQADTGAYSITTRPDRLTPAQRIALTTPSGGPPSGTIGGSRSSSIGGSPPDPNGPSPSSPTGP